MQGWKSGCQVGGCKGRNWRRHLEPKQLVRHARMEHTREELFRYIHIESCTLPIRPVNQNNQKELYLLD